MLGRCRNSGYPMDVCFVSFVSVGTPTIRSKKKFMNGTILSSSKSFNSYFLEQLLHFTQFFCDFPTLSGSFMNKIQNNSGMFKKMLDSRVQTIENLKFVFRGSKHQIAKSKALANIRKLSEWNAKEQDKIEGYLAEADRAAKVTFILFNYINYIY